MKRRVLMLLMMLLPMMVMAQDYTVQVDNVWYTINGYYARAKSASNCSGDIVIPKTVTYYINSSPRNATVNGIMERAFAGSAIQGVTIPNTVTSISSDAFRNCSQLASIVVEEGNAKYDSRDNCNAIIETGSNTLITGCKNTVIPNTVTTIDSYAFYGCTGLTALNIPNSVTAIGTYAFCGCTGLTTLTIPGNVTNVGGFSNCTNLATVIMQNGVTNIATNAFYGCSSLANVTFPNSVMSIGGGAFDGTAWYNNLPEGIVYAGNVAFSYKGTMSANTNLVFRDGTTGIAGRAFAHCTGILSVTIPNTVETIGDEAFSDCTNLMFATIGNSVTSIGDYAFDGCYNLTSVTVGMATPTTITDNTFSNRSKAKLYVPNGKKTAYSGAAYWQDFKEIMEIAPTTSATKITFADPMVKNICLDQWDTNGDREISMQEAAAVTDLGSAFRYKKTITSFDELKYFTGLTSIGSQAFSDCTNLTCVTIPSSVTSIGNQAFYSCTGLEDITIPGGVKTVGNYAFYKCTGLVSVAVPNSVTSIGEKSFQNCSGLTSLTIGSAVTSIGASAFNGCSNLASVSLGNAVTSIGQSAFALCTSLSSIIIPNSVSTIEGYTFSGCTSLANITISNSVTSIGSNAFYGCNSLENIVIPNTVTNIGQSAFEGCSGIKNITIPKSVTSIGNKAFYNTGIYTNASDGVFYVDKWVCGYKGTIPSNVTIAFDEGTYAISNSAFNSCNEIMEITIPNSVVIIGSMVFAYCSNLTTVTIGNSVTSIGSFAFYGCSNLATVTVGATTPPTLGSDGLSSYFINNGSLYVPIGSKSAYKAADNWKNVSRIFENSPRIVFADATVKAVCVEKWDTDGDGEISEYEAGLVTSLDNAFYSKRGLITSFDELRYFTGLTAIGSDDFSGWIALKSVTVPSGVTTIHPYAFNQSALETLSIDVNNATFYSPDGSNAIINRSTKELVKGCKTTIIPDDVTSIGNGAFYYCTGLTSIDIPNSVNNIADNAFFNCSALVSVTIPNTVKSIGKMAFFICPMTSITIPEGIEAIGDYAFEGCTGLTSIVIPGSISSLGRNVFDRCANLATVTITDGIETIGEDMFFSCKNLTSITIPSSVTSISYGAFYGCSNLENITIPSSVASIGDNAFAYCSALSSVTVEWQKPIYIYSSVFSNSNQSNATLYVPAGRAAAYNTASNWKNFKSIVEIEEAKVVLSKTKATMEKGKSGTLKATVYPETLADKSVTWESSNTKIATVSSAGKVKAVKTGTVTITCTSVATGATATCEITVGKVNLDKSEAVILKGTTLKLTPSVYPTTLEDKSVTWKSSDTKVATVTSAGKVKAVGVGTAIITCTSNATGLSATCTLTVGKVVLSKTKATVTVGKSGTLKATVYPETLADKSVTWTTSDKKVATVSTAGKVKAVGVGTAIITCTSNATGLKATCTLTVGQVVLSKTEAIVAVGKTGTLKATVYPETLADKSVTWKSSDTEVATVTSAGKVKAVGVGTAIITCTSKATGLSATCTLTVGKVVLSKSKATVAVGKAGTLKATVYPETLEDKSVTWKSSDKKVATVSSAGRVKAVGVGTAKITCTSVATGLSATCTVTVTASVGTRSLDGDDDELTDIGDMEIGPAVTEPFDVYDLSGRKVRHQVTSLDGLPNGIYIVKGRKVLKKD